jgi:hypothetical protein
MIPMWQSEALWVRFNSHTPAHRGSAYPFAVKVAAGKRDALTGASWWPKLRGERDGYGQDYCVVPAQPWLDGFVVEKGKIRQFVAQPLGQGLTVEAQLDGKEEFGGLQLQVYPMKGSEYDRRFPYTPPPPRRNRLTKSLSFTSDSRGDATYGSNFAVACCALADSMDDSLCRSVEMGMGAGGLMAQSVYNDPFRMEDWDQEHTSRTYVHLINSSQWQDVTGERVPTQPFNANLYNRYRYPWYQFYQDGPTLEASPLQGGIKSIQQLAAEKGMTDPMLNPIAIHGTVKTGNW